MKDCPPDAIHRNPNGEVFSQHIIVRQLPAQLPVWGVQTSQVNPERRAPSLGRLLTD
jgi:hypothetical protein